ncbi:MAG: hypothetical protein KAS77_06905 [Thermoplasmata archaeon]|nr:hypothetical protein [Thermoplasmata archaeon]
MHNVCSECHRKFNPDLRYCPYCRGEAKVPRTKGWNYDEGELIRSSDPMEDEHRTAYRQNGFLLLVAIILLVPGFAMLLGAVLDILSDDADPEIIAIFIYGIFVSVAVVYGAICAFYAKRPGAQILAAFLIWANIAWIDPIVFLGVGVVFFIIWGLGASRSGVFMKPDPTYLVVMTSLSIMCIIGGYIWLMTGTIVL